MNFLVAGYASSDGAVLVDPSIAPDAAHVRVDGPIVGYARGFAVGQMSAKIDAGIARVCLDGTATFKGQPAARHVCGFSDAKVRWSVNFLGAPALTLPQFPTYRQKLVAGASLQLGVPVGDYDAARLVNIGANRWSSKAQIGVSKAVQRWTLELSLAGTYYEANDDFYGGHRREQDAIYSLQGHVVYGFASGVWIALDLTHYRGGRTTTDGLADRNLQSNGRTGFTLALPINRAQSVKLYLSSGVLTRTGTDFDTVGAAWQYRWGGRR